MMKKLMISLAAAFLLCVVSGCQNMVMQTGRYLTAKQGEFACIYQDLIFLRVLAPDNQTGALTYWEWAGGYSVNSDTHELELKIKDKDFARRWKFSYALAAGRGCLVLQDHRTDKKRYLVYEVPSLRTQPENMPRPAGSAGVDPVYGPMIPAEQK